jgi:hypothetical protein
LLITTSIPLVFFTKTNILEQTEMKLY